MTQLNTGTIQKIAIIGAGPSGLATAKYLLAENSFSQIVIYEQRDNVGGTWNYTPLQDKSKRSTNDHHSNGHPTSTATSVVTAGLPDFNTPMYDGLESNLPHMLMQYSDTPFPVATQLFPSRETVLEYLETYATDVRSLISFRHQVISVAPTAGDEYHGWEVKVQETTGAHKSKVEEFDAVIAANGHCGWPKLPDIEGLDTWAELYPESLFHSVSYKNPQAFKDKRVLLVGSGPSAADLIHQIGSLSAHPLLLAQSEKSPYHTDAAYTTEHPALTALLPHQRTARFQDGSTEHSIDAIFLCTGYAHRYPFLAPLAPAIETEGLGALPLPYQHIFHTQHPTLAFVELPEKIIPFPLAEAQAAVLARVFSGRLPLPSLPERLQWQNKERVPGRKKAPHVLGPPRDLEYMNELYTWCEQATRAKEKGGKGKMPKWWDARAYWLRMAAPEMKKAFNRKGEARHDIETYEELGFGF